MTGSQASADKPERRTVGLPTALIVRIGFITLAFIVGAALLWQASGLLLVLFAGILIAVLLDSATQALSVVAPLPRALWILLVSLALAATIAVSIWIAGPELVSQSTRLSESLGSSLSSLRNWAMSIQAVEETVDSSSTNLTELLPSPEGLLGGVTTVLGSTLGGVVNVALIVIFGIYFALNPTLYRDGLIRMLPVSRRAAGRELLHEMGTVLRWWLGGKALMMVALGVCSYFGLSLIGVPLALLLAVVAGLTSFIPVIGPAIAGTLMILVALTEGWQTAAWAGGLYVVLQGVESYLLTPLVEGKAVSLPAGVVIATQVLMGILFGALGVALATPLAAVGAVAVRRLYIEDTLETGASA